MTFYLCEKCGGIDWTEHNISWKRLGLNNISLEISVEDEGNQEESVFCSECRDEETLYGLEEEDMDKEELKKLVNMDEDERLEWLKNHKILNEL